MKKISIIMLLFIAIGGQLPAQVTPSLKSVKAKVGKQPIAIIPAKINGTFNINPDTLNIICLGYDANFNGEFDEGDELPSWWKIERVIDANPFEENPQPFNVRKVMDFETNWGQLFPFRMRVPDAVDGFTFFPEYGNYLIIPYVDKIVIYDMSTEEESTDEDGDEYVGYIPNIKSAFVYTNLEQISNMLELLMLQVATQRNYDDPNNWMPTENILGVYMNTMFFEDYMFTYTSENQLIQRVVVYNDPTKSAEFITIAVLYEGEWGAGSVVEFHTLKTPLLQITEDMSWEEIFETKEINVGVNANDMVLLNYGGVPYLFVVSSGDNRIYIVDGVEQEVSGYGIGIDEGFIQIPCEAPNSIREVSFKLYSGDYGINNCIAATISSYDGNTYYIHNIFTSTDFDDEHIYNTIIPDGKMSDASYLFSPWDDIFFARTLTMDENYSPLDEVEIFYCGVVGITEINNSLKVFPNPAEDIVNIELENITEINSVRLINNEGKYLETLNYSVSENIIQINIPHLQIGNYFIEVDTKQSRYIQKIIVK